MSEDDIRNKTVVMPADMAGKLRDRLRKEKKDSIFYSSESSSNTEKKEPINKITKPIGNSGISINEELDTLDDRDTVQIQVNREKRENLILKDKIVYKSKTVLAGFLVSFDKNGSGDFFPLYSGEVFISNCLNSEQNIFAVSDTKIEEKQAKFNVSFEGKVTLTDLAANGMTKLKKFGTNNYIELMSNSDTLDHGDVLVIDKRNFHIVLIKFSV